MELPGVWNSQGGGTPKGVELPGGWNSQGGGTPRGVELPGGWNSQGGGTPAHSKLPHIRTPHSLEPPTHSKPPLPQASQFQLYFVCYFAMPGGSTESKRSSIQSTANRSCCRSNGKLDEYSSALRSVEKKNPVVSSGFKELFSEDLKINRI